MKFPNKFLSAGTAFADRTSFVSAPFFKKVFKSEKPFCGTAVISAVGFYKLFINGTDVTKGEMAPYINNPDDTVYYDRYEVGHLLKNGENVVTVLLGNGFANNSGGALWNFHKAHFRSAPKFAFGLDITSESGATQFIDTDGFMTVPSPILFDDYRCGEYYDARLERDDIFTPESKEGWKKPLAVAEPAGEKRFCEADPVRCYREISPRSVKKHQNGWLYDFGENNSGVCRISIDAREGQTVTVYHGEWIKNGEFTRQNIVFQQSSDIEKEFVQKTVYICKDGRQTHVPSFVYNGFRYAYVEGITEEQATSELLTYVVLGSDFGERGDFECSDPIADKLQEITRRSDRSCFIYFPNDCPQREKNGWTADAALSCEHMLLNFGVEKSLTEWLRNIVYAQNDRGALPGVVPTGGWGFEWGNGPNWDQVLLEIPYRIYQYRGTTDAIEIAASAILKYILYIASCRDGRGLLEMGLGDWVPVVYNGSPKAPDVTDISITSMDIFRRAAVMFKAIGDKNGLKTAEKLYAEMRESIRRELVDFDTMTVFGNCQTSQAMGIYYGVFEPSEKAKAFEVLLNMIDAADGHLAVGVLGGRVLFHVLSENGKADLAYNMITRPDNPSYGYWVEKGATTLWEGFYKNPDERVDSLNHHFWGDISHWFISAVAGIVVNPEVESADRIDIRPNFIEKLERASAWHNSAVGRVSSKWERLNDGDIILSVTASDKMRGTVSLPDGWHFADGTVSATLGSGSYRVLKSDRNRKL